MQSVLASAQGRCSYAAFFLLLKKDVRNLRPFFPPFFFFFFFFCFSISGYLDEGDAPPALGIRLRCTEHQGGVHVAHAQASWSQACVRQPADV